MVYRTLSPKDEKLIRESFGEIALRHSHFSPDVALGAIDGNQLAGFLSAYSRPLPDPLKSTNELYVDFIEVLPLYRNKGIASHLISCIMNDFKSAGFYQIRSWSSEDRIEMINLWKKLGFSLCPAHIFPNNQKVFGFFVSYK